MNCFIKNIPPGATITSGNRGINFPYNTCELPEAEVCFLAKDDNGQEIELQAETGEIIILRCIE